MTITSAARARRAAKALIAVSVVGAVSLMGAAPAQASDWGGDGDSAGCASPITVATTAITGSRGKLAGKTIGELQLRWSWSCHGNWSRVVLYGGMYSTPVTVEQIVESEGRRAGSTDHNLRTGSGGTSAWTRYLRLANSQSRACAQAWLSSDFDTLNYHTNGARVCA
ncbi:hypothetical protein [Actinokineospora diospyrosa]|uniref:DUF2690 domain-containing protein n=1 Tax=Actinokineospora diospyrosa TaxID=103728 RepID=A0ABT1IFI0_9PSEU|nr:hypothetical protein [Actinokineospora diospyrosa]MCP2271036.1 hypothetical protein [Actinokineospora diospyrosa]